MNTKIYPSQRYSPNCQAVRGLPPIQQLAFAVRSTGRAGQEAGKRFPEPASAGGRKQHDGLAGGIIGFRERVDDGRRNVPQNE